MFNRSLIPGRSADGARVRGGPGADEAQAPMPGPFWAKITGQAASTNRYAWTQLDEGDTAAFDTNLSAGFAAEGTSGTTGSPAYEINGLQTVPTGTRVLLWPAGDRTYYVFEYAAASGGALDSDEGALGSTYTITANSAWENTGVSLSLPEAGTYFLFGRATGYLQVSAAGAAQIGWLSVRLHDGTIAVPNTEAVLCSLSTVGYQLGTAGIATVLTVAGATTITLQALADPGAGVTIAARQIIVLAGGEGGANLGYLKVG